MWKPSSRTSASPHKHGDTKQKIAERTCCGNANHSRLLADLEATPITPKGIMMIFDSMIVDTQQAVDKLDPAARDTLNTQLNITAAEHAAWQEAKSLAYASGRIGIFVSNELYRLLGCCCDTFNSQSLATKIVVTKLMSAILIHHDVR
jgi:hypothetical protein